MNVCGCVVMVLKLYIFSAVTHSSTRRGVVMARRVATLPMSCFIVREITTMSVPQIYAGYLGTSQSQSLALVVICGICEVEQRRCYAMSENRRYVDWSPTIVDKTEAKEMYAVSVSRSKVSRLLVAEAHS